MVKTGIDTIALYTPRYALDLALLAKARALPEDKFVNSLGQLKMSVPPPGEDIVTMAASAGAKALEGVDPSSIDMLLFATESGIDQSKAAGIYVHDLLNLPKACRVIELKQACYSATFGLQLVMAYLREHPNKKVLLVASDIARYGLGSTGESSQGACACAMVLSSEPRLISIENEFSVWTENVMDFWRPNYCDEAMVDGKYSSKLYLTMLEKTYLAYRELSKRGLNDHAYYCYHTPVPRLVENAHYHLTKMNSVDESKEIAASKVKDQLHYARLIGNSYSASLYVSIASLLDNAQNNLAGKRLGFYSYGSGCVAEFFSGVIEENYREHLHTNYHTHLLNSRQNISHAEYESLYQFNYVQDGSLQEVPIFDTGAFRLARLENHKRQYEKAPSRANAQDSAIKPILFPQPKSQEITTVFAPAKLILSGEHSVVHGGPALAMAINRYAKVIVTRDKETDFAFDLTNLAHHSRLSFAALKVLKERIKNKYNRFIRGDFSIRDVLQKPFELAQFALSILSDTPQFNLPHGVNIKVQSDIPIGCGMGSSAATILSVLKAIANYLHLPLSEESLFKVALEAENMQHGSSSGLDLRIALNGGCIYVCGKELVRRDAPNFALYLVNTGAPLSSTGQCIERVKPHFQSNQLKDEFASVTNAMDDALQQQSFTKFKNIVAHNHQLLTHIGVVPNRVQQFIAGIEAMGGAAKVCGAGAISGDNAGAVLIAFEDQQMISTYASRFNYQLTPVACEQRGVHAA